MHRRDYLRTVTGIGALAALPAGAASAAVSTATTSDDGHHPGPPRFTQAGEPFTDRLLVDFDPVVGGKDRDNFAPRIRGTPQRDPENYAASDFSWSLTERPADSEASLLYAPSDDGIEQYDSGAHNTVEFVPDVPGTYRLELDAPDGTHEQEVYAFPAPDGAVGGPPRIELTGRYEENEDVFVLQSNPRLAPDSQRTASDLFVKWLADGRDSLSTGDIETGAGTDSWTARIPAAALDGETARVHAAGSDGDVHSTTDTVVLDPEAGTVRYPNRPPEWIREGVMYEIFTRSFAGAPGETDFAYLESKADYLADLGVDVVWLTPIVPAESSNWKPNNGFEYVGGGPHGYDTLSYFDVAPDLGSDGTGETAMAEYRAFVDACHERDIKVCFDLVINHCGRHHPFFQDTIGATSDTEPAGWTYDAVDAWNTDSTYFDWFDRQAGPLTDDSGDVVDVAPATAGFAGLRVMPNLNYGNVALREHIMAAAEFWAGEVGVDAFRCDIAYGVPHSFWKELRQRVRRHDSEFMLLDETIPNDISFAENEFDMHFDTADFMTAAHSVGRGEAPASALLGAVEKRPREGWPDYTLLTNATENHDERRLLRLAIEAGTRENPEKVQRAAWAAGVCLPGVPFIYYGQERQISKYGTNRHDYDGSGDDPRTGGDVAPGRYSRAFMNWAEDGATVPEAHLQFYKDVVSLYHETTALTPAADLAKVGSRAEGDVLVFGRDASHLEAVSGPEKAVVVLNFESGPVTVDLPPEVGTTDRFSGSDVGVAATETYQRIEVDTLAVLPTPELGVDFETVVTLSDPAGDDDGPGGYTYPSADAFYEGAFDTTGVTIEESDFRVRFSVEMATPVQNPWNLPRGFSHQFFQFYLRDRAAGDGTPSSTTGREGTDVTFERPYHYRVVVNGQYEAQIEAADGTVRTQDVGVEVTGEAIAVDVPREALGDLTNLDVAPLLCPFDGFGRGHVRAVAASNGPYTIGGGSDGRNDPRVMDLLTPEGVDQATALAYDADERATVPFVDFTERALREQIRVARRQFDDLPDAAFGPNGRGMRRSIPNQFDTVEGHLAGERYRPAANVLESIHAKVNRHLEPTAGDGPSRADLLSTLARALAFAETAT